eukprot:jgi/Ulvmu1/11372/UM075_0034.1
MVSSICGSAFKSGPMVRTRACNRMPCARASALPRREAVLSGVCLLTTLSQQPAEAGILTKARPKKVPIEEYSTSKENGLKFYDLEEGVGGEVARGDKVTVHFDCYIGKVDVVSSRYSALLGKNEIIPEPFGFIAGKPVGQRKAKKADGGQANAAFSGQNGPKPPPALSTAVLGMKKGGKRSVIVTPDQAYGDSGYEEVPGGATVEMQIEVLEIGRA